MTRSTHPRHRALRRIVAGALIATLGVAGLIGPAAEAGSADPSRGSMYSVVDQIGARALWEQGITGDGVTVAVVDTGVAPVDALLGADKVVAMVDLSFESTVPEAVYLDTYGHGTHMAGIIAGRTPGADPASAADNPDWFLGVAPDAALVSVKVGDNTGAADVSQIIAGVDWVTDHADELGIDVLNLSYGSSSTLTSATDPLSYAVERAWKAGIVVVVSAGNDGRSSDGLGMPAQNPYVIAVGAVEPKNNGDFRVPSWSAGGDGVRDPDVGAPGASIESLRVPGSRADLEHPEGYVDDQLFLGSGSSQAAAVVSGAAALILDARPDLEPDEVKALLMSDTAAPTPALTKFAGAGVIQLDQMADLAVPSGAVQTHVPANGSGSLELARGGVHVALDGVPVIGEITVHGDLWLGTAWHGTAWHGTAWHGTAWHGASWTGEAWLGTAWHGSAWDGTAWHGTAWHGTAWHGADWTGASWSGTAWHGSSWAGTAWHGTAWHGTAWHGTAWHGTAWRSYDGAWS